VTGGITGAIGADDRPPGVVAVEACSGPVAIRLTRAFLTPVPSSLTTVIVIDAVLRCSGAGV
jgi:hypothetical protein